MDIMEEKVTFKNMSPGTLFVADNDDNGKEISKVVGYNKVVTLSKKAYEDQKNSPLFLKGYLVMVKEAKAKEDIIKEITANALTDKEIKELLDGRISNILQRLQNISSPVTLRRILAKTKNKTVINCIEKKLKEK